MQAMLLAAGFGTRLQPYSFIRPKPLFPVLNRPLLLILADLLKQAQCRRIIVNGHHLSSQVQEAVADIDSVIFQHEQEILGTGGSLRLALAHCDNEPLLVMNGDICHNIDVAELYRHHLASGNRVTMALHDLARFNTVGVLDGQVISFRAGGREEGSEYLAFTGIQVVDPDIIRRMPGGRFYHIIDLYEELLREGEKIGLLRVDGSLWQDMGTPEDYLHLHGLLLAGSRDHGLPVPMPEGQWLIDPHATVGEKASFSGWGCIGKATVGRNVSLHNCVVWDNAVISAGSRLENAIVTGGEF